MPRPRKSPSADENWVHEEMLSNWHKKAISLAGDRKRYEKAQIKQGKKRVLIPHLTSPRCFIEKFV